ncbi:helix-turn-helix domain-containing protein [Pseudomonas izuensis]|uniref:Helix-turn-helix domain-containing protein n=1 Tax=Pseudomonas izuensis TaxID=2684212 RepID=A0ABM7RP17_9PSED|nr:helix-turn-helix domain-containing protein [Pseudomonas izuensis]BCX66956.1 helix-turn-helix domain-containing protein [Pseudomonas izuensis]
MHIESLRDTHFPDARSSERVLHLRVSESPVQLVSQQCATVGCLPTGWEGLIAMSGAFEAHGSMQALPIAQAPLVKLQVFIDLGNALNDQRPGPAPWAALPVAYPTVQCERALERWYIEQSMVGGVAYQAFASVLRHTEGYGLVRFLLEQGTHSEKLTTLAQRYGVSVSHFRRLCRQALGTAAKPALRGWRTAQALLNMSLQGGSLTDVALEFGFASSSHFSKEIRELVGFTPSSLADITYLPGK